MLTLVAIFLLASLTLVAISLQKTYYHIPVREVKRRAQQGDAFAIMLYRAVAYDLSLDILLWVIIGICASGFFVIVSRAVPPAIALLGCISLLWVGFAWIPGTRLTRPGSWLARTLTPGITWLLRHLYPLLRRAAKIVKKHHPIAIHTGLYQKEDLVELIDQQKVQADNRIGEEEIRIARQALTFSDKLVRDIMIPRRVVKMVNETDDVGPVLMGELHESGHSRFPVYHNKTDNIVGTLYLHDLVGAKLVGKVKDIMDTKVYYVNEEKPLQHALQAFLKTKHHLFIVVNNFEEFVGIISIEDVLEQIIGKPIMDEFDQYEDMRAVAQLEAQREQRQHEQAPKTDK